MKIGRRVESKRNERMKNMKFEFQQIVQWILLVAFLILLISFAVISLDSYTFDAYFMRSMPIAVLTGCTAIGLGLAVSWKNR
ncbi:hypothetical protein HMPREF9372_2054 [Sporosarcina newyorkensis 2681]|uniref:Uncharacterized protein n=3 Tax=Sporosarcina TaxID=1569 RepID=F9DTC3_9BACL|nr:hypothetical protein HMPREF9372_2054 [Sporosarcina newyorkensis 2681]